MPERCDTMFEDVYAENEIYPHYCCSTSERRFCCDEWGWAYPTPKWSDKDGDSWPSALSYAFQATLISSVSLYARTRMFCLLLLWSSFYVMNSYYVACPESWSLDFKSLRSLFSCASCWTSPSTSVATRGVRRRRTIPTLRRATARCTPAFHSYSTSVWACVCSNGL